MCTHTGTGTLPLIVNYIYFHCFQAIFNLTIFKLPLKQSKQK